MCMHLFKGTFGAGRTHRWISHTLRRRLVSCVCTIRTLVISYLFFPPFICQACGKERCTSGAVAAGGKMPWIVLRLSVPGGLTETETVLSGSCGSAEHNRWEAKNLTLLKKKKKKRKKKDGGPCDHSTAGPYLYERSQTSPSVYTGRRLSTFMVEERWAALCLHTDGGRAKQQVFTPLHPWKTLWTVCEIQGGSGGVTSPRLTHDTP